MALDRSEALEPTDLGELARDLKAAAAEGAPLRVEGGGTKRGWLVDRPIPDATLRTTGLARVLEHAHGDLTCTVEAGVRLGDVQARLAKRDQRIAIDPASGPDATIGGVFATDESGPARIAFGSLREQVIGISFALADGTVARSGGKVIKNVAGYDLCKLFCGSRGALGVVAELSIRLYPLPEAQASLRVPCEAIEGARAALALDGRTMTPTGLVHQDGALLIRFEGERTSVEGQLSVAKQALRRLGVAEVLTGSDSVGTWASRVAERRPKEDELVVAATARPAEVPGMARGLVDDARRNGVTMRLALDPRLGQVLLFASGKEADLDRLVTEGRETATRHRGSLRVRNRNGRRLTADPEGPPPPAAALMRAVKRALDPEGRLMPGLAYRFLAEEAGR